MLINRGPFPFALDGQLEHSVFRLILAERNYHFAMSLRERERERERENESRETIPKYTLALSLSSEQRSLESATTNAGGVE